MKVRLSDPDAFLRAFGEYCFGDPAQDPTGERERIGRKLAWYESHLVNMLADFVESGAAAALLSEPGDWVAAREQKHVDLALCPPSFQKDHSCEKGVMLNPHTPLYDDEGLWKHVIATETKVIPSANWVDIWRSAFKDLSGKSGKPACDYVLACIHLFEKDRPAKAKWCYDACKAFAGQKPGQVLRLQMAGGGSPKDAQIKDGAKIRYVARWPVDPGPPDRPNMIRTPHPRPTWGRKRWRGMESGIFLVLLARA